MDECRLIIKYIGNWEKNVYSGQLSELTFVPSDITYKALLGEVHGLFGADLGGCHFKLRTMLKSEGTITIFCIKMD